MGGRAVRRLRVAADVAMAVVFTLLMSTALVEEVAHEWLGAALGALFVVHQVLNRRWWSHLFKGRYSALRVAQTAAVLGLTACVLVQLASSVVLSEHVLAWLPAVSGASWARVAHLLGSYWGFLFMAAHAGLHVAPAMCAGSGRRASPLRWIDRAAVLAMSCFGAWSFVQLDYASYLTLGVQFVFADYELPLALAFAEHASIAVLVGGLAHCLAAPLRKRSRPSTKRGKMLEIPRGTPARERTS